MKYLKLFEEFEFDDTYYDEKHKWQILYDKWFSSFAEYRKNSDDQSSLELKQLLKENIPFNEAHDIIHNAHKERLKKWKEINPAPVFQIMVDIEKESNRNELAFNEIIKRLKLNKTRTWGNGTNPMDDDFGNYNTNNKTILSIKPHYLDTDGEYEDDEYMDGIKLELIMVHPLHRNKGLATKRLLELFQLADELKVKVFLVVVPQDDETSQEKLIEFYKKFGFIQNDEWEEEYMVREPK